MLGFCFVMCSVRGSVLGALAFLLVPAIDPIAASAATYVLAVGINDYEYEQQLAGAEADAVDIAETLRKIGADVTLLRNKDATRESIEQAWRAILGRAQSGDIVIFSYAGHGGQEPDKAPLDEVDGLDEAFLLSGFHPDTRHKGFNERLLDDTIHEWLAAASAKGLKVIFVADACHSGTMTRANLDNRVVVTFRGRPPYGLTGTTSLAELKQAAAQLPATATAREDDVRNVTFLSATQENRRAPEVLIKGSRRGALSYAFARALEGAADANRDGTLSRFELEAYIQRQVRQISEAQQAPDLRPRGGQDFELLSVTPPPEFVDSVILGTIALGVLGLSPEEAQALAGRLSGADLTAPGKAADLVWDAATKDVISGIGDPVAHDITPSSLQGVINKWRVLAVLKRLVAARPVDIHLDPDDSRHVEGSEVAIYTEPLTQVSVTVIDIQPDGTLSLLYPIPSDPPLWPAGRPYRVDRIAVQAPFGADHVLLIASHKPLVSLHASLKTLPLTELPALLEQELSGTDYRLGLLALYTAASRKGQ